jgi:hypothetical protein
MSSVPPSQAELEFYYYGLYRALRRYRMMTILGWTVVALGIASVPLGWRYGQIHGLLDLALSGSAVVAGLALVQQSVASLETYLRVPFPPAGDSDGADQPSTAVNEIRQLMKDLDEGGWLEAYGAIGKLKEMQSRHGLPPLE